ncbi:MAG: LytTR family DNA-binding domain-containing protein [Bacteroidota bacterium]
MVLKCMIVDDEPLALSLLEKYISRTGFLQLVHRCKNAVQAKQVLKDAKIDLIFLDIHMPELTGMEFSKSIDIGTRIIFTTAFDQYAIEGYKVNALDYLLKPFNYEEFLAAATRAKEWFEKSGAFEDTRKDYLFVRSEYKQIRVKLTDVLYFEGLKDYIKIWLKDNPRPVLTLLSLKALENELPSSLFMRIHRSFIIALDKVTMIDKNQVVIGKTHITISRPYKEAFREYMNGK